MAGKDWTPDEVKEAYRTAVAMAQSAQANDPRAVGELWNGTENKPALIWALSRVPSVMTAALLAIGGADIDLAEVWKEMTLIAASFDEKGGQDGH